MLAIILDFCLKFFLNQGFVRFNVEANKLHSIYGYFLWEKAMFKAS